MVASVYTTKAEGLGNLLKNLGKASAKAGEKVATNVMKNPGRALEVAVAKIGSAAVSRIPKALSTIPDVVNSFHTDKEKYLENFRKRNQLG